MITMNNTTVTLPFYEYERLKNYGELVSNKDQFCVIEDPIEGRSYVVGRDRFSDDCKAVIQNLEQQLTQERNDAYERDMDIYRLELKQQPFKNSIWYKLYKFFNR